ncbi:MAG TPA: flagellar hook capping FlgD N-terminal domain-containing protein [Candidatus Elarobacter sp.]|jgi:flagellar basal-body rod modification protein FlgD
MSSVPSTGGLAIDGLITQNQSPAKTAAPGSYLGQDAFLQLLTTQLRNQDPLHPLDDTQSIAQLAQFSALQATTDLKNTFASFESNFAVMQSAGLLGKTVSAQATDPNGNVSTVTGIVKTISVINGTPQITLADASGKLLTDANGSPLQLPTSAILSIGTSSSSSASTVQL